MASKKTTYPLLAAVLVIWGVIAYKLLVPGSKDVSVSTPKAQAAAAVSRERDSLRANYRDPFLGGMPRQERKVVVSPVLALPSTPPPRETIAVTCHGSLVEGQNTYCLISLDGRRHMLAPGESAEGFLLARITPDSIFLQKSGQYYSAKRNQ